MTVRRFTSWSLAAALLACASASSFSAIGPKPKLVVGIIIDQFRYDYLTRFRSDYHGGINQLLTQGADFTNAFYAQVPTVTAVGHSIFMSGAMPAVSGIVNNVWYDREEAKVVTSVCDWDTKTVGGQDAQKGTRCTDEDPASPKRMLVSTVGDELRNAHEDSKVIGISLKARAAILPSGHRATGAYWFDDVTGNFISSTFFMDQLPAWAISFNERKLPAQYVNRKWEASPNRHFSAPQGSKTPYAGLPASPWGNELVEQFSEQAITGEKLGQRDATDLLTVSFSSNDYIGHAVGPDAPEVRDMAIRTDQLIGKLFQLLDERIGLKNVIVVLSADHGVATIPSRIQATKMPGGYISGAAEKTIGDALSARFGAAEWVLPGGGETNVYLNASAMANVKAPAAEVYRVAREALLSNRQLHVARVYTREQLESGVTGDFVAAAEMNGFNQKRSGDLAIVYEPGYMPGHSGTTHFSPYAYDRHVPVLFMGPGIKPGRYDDTIQPNDIAPTLAAMLDIQTPSGSSGRVLTEMLTK